MSIAQRIEAAKSAIAAKKEELAKLVEEVTNGADVDAEVIETLTKSIEDDQAKVASLEKAEAALVQKTAPAFIKNKNMNDYSFEKSALVALKAYAENKSQVQVATELYGEDSGTVQVAKAATAEARTDVASWAQELVQTSYQGFLDQLRGVALLPQIAARGGVSLSFDKYNQVIVPFKQSTPTLAGAWVGEGKSIPVKKTAFGSKTVNQFKLGVITVATSEILRKSTPAIEPILRDAIIQDTAAMLDAHAFSATAATATSPAGLLVGVTATAAATAGMADVLTAVKTVVNAQTAANRAVGKLVAVMSPAVHLGLSLMQNALGQFTWQSELASGRFMGMDVLVSTHAPADTITFIDASQMYFGISAPEFKVSDTAALQMDDAPSTGPALNASLFQQDMYAIRMIANIGYADIRGGSVSQISGLTGI